MHPAHTYTHKITPQAVDLEERSLVAALAQGGYDPQGLDLSAPATQRLVDEATEAATNIGIDVVQRHWSRSSDGGVEVAIVVAREVDLPLLKLALA